MPFGDMFHEVEKRLKYRFWDKGRQRSNRAKGFRDGGIILERCIMRHRDFAYSGPPDDMIKAYVCLHCHAAACEPEIKDRGYDFQTCPIAVMDAIMDDDFIRQRQGNSRSFGGFAPMGGGNQGRSGANSDTAR